MQTASALRKKVEQCKVESAHIILRCEVSEHEHNARLQQIQTAAAAAQVAQARHHASSSVQDELRGIRTVEAQARQSLGAFETEAQESVQHLQRNLEVVEGEFVYEETLQNELRSEAQGYRGFATSALSQQRQRYAEALFEEQQIRNSKQEQAERHRSEIWTLQLQQQEQMRISVMQVKVFAKSHTSCSRRSCTAAS